MTQDLHDTLSLLARTPAVLEALLRDLPDTWTLRNEGGSSWSAAEVVAHLVHAEHTDWIPRAGMILQYGETRMFEPFDRGGHVEESHGLSLQQCLGAFARSRAASLDQLRGLNLTPEDLERRGCHPSLGTVTLGALLATWVVHDLTHVHQISRIMAHQYR
ncbi:MAG: DinB family protein, partial [Vicinamibacterales bacterium]